MIIILNGAVKYILEKKNYHKFSKIGKVYNQSGSIQYKVTKKTVP